MRLGGRRRKGIDLEYFERGGDDLVDDDDTMANGDEEARVMFVQFVVCSVMKVCVVRSS